MSTPLPITFHVFPHLSPHQITVRAIHAHAHTFQFEHLNIMTTSTNHIFYLCEHCRVYLVELWLPVESVVHQLKMVHGPKRSGYNNLAELWKVQ